MCACNLDSLTGSQSCLSLLLLRLASRGGRVGEWAVNPAWGFHVTSACQAAASNMRLAGLSLRNFRNLPLSTQHIIQGPFPWYFVPQIFLDPLASAWTSRIDGSAQIPCTEFSEYHSLARERVSRVRGELSAPCLTCLCAFGCCSHTFPVFMHSRVQLLWPVKDSESHSKVSPRESRLRTSRFLTITAQQLLVVLPVVRSSVERARGQQKAS